MLDDHPPPSIPKPTTSPVKQTSILPASSTHFMMPQSHGINGAATDLNKKLAPKTATVGTTPSTFTIYPNEKADLSDWDSPFSTNQKSNDVQEHADIAFPSMRPTSHTQSKFTLHANNTGNPPEDRSICANW